MPQLSELLVELHREVRLGNFTSSKHLADQCLAHPRLAEADELLQLRAHTLSWEVYDSLGNSSRASQCLRYNPELSKNAKSRLREALQNPTAFCRREFPDGASNDTRAGAYALWRQRVFVQMAEGLSAYRDHLLPHSNRLLEEASQFIHKCLLSAGFKCSGTQARLHLFKGLLAQRQRLIIQAADHLDKSLEFCQARLEERLKIAKSDIQRDTERAFASYSLGKLHIHIGELEFDKGRLNSARRYLSSGKTLVIATEDYFLANRAALLLCRVARSDEEFGIQGWALLESVAACRDGLQDHPEFFLEAQIEEVKTAVYLHHEGKDAPGSPPKIGLTTTLRALEAVNPLIEKASTLKLRQSEFHALLVKARVLTRLGDLEDARKAVQQARGLYSHDELPSPLDAEAAFVLGKTYLPGKSFSTALRLFREALRIGHESLVFQASCHLQILEILIKEKKFTEARVYLRRCDEVVRNVESAFLRRRRKKVVDSLQSLQSILFRFDHKFELETAKSDLEKFYLRNLAALIDRNPRELTKASYWRMLLKKRAEDKRRVKNLLDKHFPEKPKAG